MLDPAPDLPALSTVSGHTECAALEELEDGSLAPGAEITISSSPALLAPDLRNERGALSVAERRGRVQGLRHGVEALCAALGIELTDERRRELVRLDTAGLEALLARLRERKSWT